MSPSQIYRHTGGLQLRICLSSSSSRAIPDFRCWRRTCNAIKYSIYILIILSLNRELCVTRFPNECMHAILGNMCGGFQMSSIESCRAVLKFIQFVSFYLLYKRFENN